MMFGSWRRTIVARDKVEDLVDFLNNAILFRKQSPVAEGYPSSCV